jgi:hypothetical protein
VTPEPIKKSDPAVSTDQIVFVVIVLVVAAAAAFIAFVCASKCKLDEK